MVSPAEKAIHVVGRTAFVLAVLVLLLAIGYGAFTAKKLSERELSLKQMSTDIGDAMDANRPPEIEREDFLETIKADWGPRPKPRALNSQVFYRK